MEKKVQADAARMPSFWEAFASFAFLIALMAISVVVFDVSLHVPMMFAAAFAAIVAKRCGYRWKQIEKGMFNGIYAALPAILILCVVGALIGVWLLAGIVPSMIYYGLAILNPQLFLVTALFIGSITSLATGTSWGTASTIGVAFMGIGIGLGIPAPMAAGAVISGAYFGDKISPLSDTTNLTASIAGTDLFTHIKCMFKQTGIAYALTVIVFLVLGFMHTPAAEGPGAEYIRQGLQEHFTISPLLLIPPVAVIVAISFKVPALPGIFIGVVLGAIFGMIAQGVSFGEVLSVGRGGFSISTGTPELDRLLSRGGIAGMMYSVSLTILAMAFGGIMELTRQLEVVVERIIKLFVRGTTSLVATTVGTTIATNATMPEQYISIILPTKMFATAYRKRGFHPKMLSGAVDGTGTLTSSLIPWNTCGIFMASILGVTAFQYAPFAVLNWSVPIIIIVLAALGKFTYKLKDDPSGVTSAYEETFADETDAEGAEGQASATETK